MDVKLFSCSECGAPLKVAKGQFISVCNFCDVQYYIKQDFPPAITIKDNVNLKEAKNIVLTHLKDKVVSKGFVTNSFFEKGTLFFIPFLEIRGIKAKNLDTRVTGRSEFGYTAYDYVEHGSNMSDIDLDFIEGSILQRTLLHAEQAEYEVVKMRKKGVVLPLKSKISVNGNLSYVEDSVVEKHVRIIYFPVWEINYTYRGILFKSYISAIDGTPIKIQALKDHKKKLLFSILGLFGLAILLSRGLKFAFFSFKLGGFFAALSLAGGLFFVILFSFLAPYFWEMFAFREMVSLRENGVESKAINYSENNFIKFGREMLGKVELLITTDDKDNG